MGPDDVARGVSPDHQIDDEGVKPIRLQRRSDALDRQEGLREEAHVPQIGANAFGDVGGVVKHWTTSFARL